MKKIFFCIALFLIAENSFAQSGNMFNDVAFGQSVNTVLSDGDYMWFGTMSGIVRYNRITDERTYYTTFNCPYFRDNAYYKAGVLAMVKDSSGNIFASIDRRLLKFNGTSWSLVLTMTYDIIDMNITADNIIHIKGAHYLYGSMYEFYDYDPVGGGAPVNTGWVFINGSEATPNYDKSTWSSAAYGTDSLKFTRTLNSAIIEEHFFSAINPNSGNHFTLNGMYSSPNGESLFLMTETNGSGWIGVIQFGVLTYYPIPYANTNVQLARRKHVFAPNGNFAMLFYNDGLIEKIVGYTINKAYVLTFNGSQVHILDSSDIGTNYFNLKDIAFDDDNNLWLTNSFVNDRVFSNNVFTMNPGGQWSGMDVNEHYMPSFEAYASSYMAGQVTDGNGRTYFLFDNAISVLDSLYNTVTYQFENVKSLVTAPKITASKGGHLWLKYVSGTTLKLKQYYQGVLSDYTIPANISSQTFTTFLPTDSGLYYLTSISLYFFDGITWTQIVYPTSSILNLVGFDYLHNEIYFSSGAGLLVKYDGTVFTPYFTFFPQIPGYVSPNLIVIDALGNKWFLIDDPITSNTDYQLYELDYNGTLTSHYVNPLFLLQGNLTGAIVPILSYQNGCIYSKAIHNPSNGTTYLMKFDTSWNSYIIDPALFSWSAQSNFTPVYWLFGDHEVLGVDKASLEIYYPDGIINLPGINYNVVHGTAYYDLNSNFIFDSNDVPAYTSSVSSGTYSTLVDAWGNYTLHTDTGFQNIQLNTAAGVTVAPPNYSYSFGDSAGNQIFNRDFAIEPDPGLVNLSIDISNNRFRPGFNSQYFLTYKNLGYVESNATVKLIYNSPVCAFVSAVPAPASISGDTITWQMNNIQVLQTGIITVTMNTYPTIPIGTPLNPFAEIIPDSTDILPYNNTSTIFHTVRGAVDPNEKEVSASSANGVLTDSTTLTYTIYFQNTGTDTAFNIVVRDTLSSLLNLSTFQLISSSSPVQFYFQNPTTLEFLFQNILLPDSFINEPGSHGFVKFSIKPIPGLGNGDSILNTSHIYFDFNSPVQTNLVNIQINHCIPGSATAQYLNHEICAAGFYVLPQGDTAFNAGVYNSIVENVFGCDSVFRTDIVSVMELDSTVSLSADTLSSNETGVNYQWINCSANQNIAGATNQIFAATAAGDYKVFISTPFGCSKYSDCIHVTVCTISSASQQFNLCVGDSVQVGSNWYAQAGTYTNVFANAGGCDSTVTTTISFVTIDSSVSVNNHTIIATAVGFNYQWYNCAGNQTITGATNQSFTATLNGDYKVLVTGVSGCSKFSACTTITVCTNQNSSQQLTVCNGDSVQVGSNWYAQAGTYNDVFTITGGCDSTVTTTLSVLQIDTAIALNNHTITSSASGMNYQWFDCSGQLINGATNQSYTAVANGDYKVLITDSLGCGKFSDCISVEVCTNQFSSQQIVLCNGDSVQVGGSWYSQSGTYNDVFPITSGCDSTVTTTLSVSVADTTVSVVADTLSATISVTYQWYDCANSQPISGATEQVYVAQANGSYSVLVSNVDGCSAMSSCVEISDIGIGEVSTLNFQITPNPASNEIAISVSGEFVSGGLMITDVAGRKIITEKILTNHKTIVNVGEFSAGTYFVQLSSKGKIYATKKLVLIR